MKFIISGNVEKRKNLWYNIFVRVGGTVVLSLLITASVMIKTEPVKSVITSSGAVSFRQKIIIDAGHGGFDGGAVSSDGTVEKDINLLIALKLRNYLTLSGFDVVMTREEDTSTESDKTGGIKARKKDDMVNRLSLINSDKSAVCVSVHLNKFTTSSPSGAQVFYGVKNENSKKLADAVQQSLRENLQPQNERVTKKGTKDTYLLYNSEIPIIIAECGFISNAQELKLLKTDEYQTKTALAISDGIIKYFNG